MEKYNIVCHFDGDKIKADIQVANIHADAVINYINRLNISSNDKEKILQYIVERYQNEASKY